MRSHRLRGATLAVAAFGIGAAPATVRSVAERQATAERLARQHLATFDVLDFEVFSDQQWERLKESHAAAFAQGRYRRMDAGLHRSEIRGL